MAEKESLISFPEYFKNGYVLVVDDATNMRRTIKGVLRHLGIANVQEADDGDTALHMLKMLKGECLFIFLDWQMPRMHGIQVAKELKTNPQFKNIPILMVTAEGNYSQVTYAGEFGVEGYIMKPFGATMLEDKMTTVLLEKLRPPHYLKLLRAGEKVMEGGEVEKAIAFFNEALKHEESAKVYVSMAAAYDKMGMVDEAAKSYKCAVERNPQYLVAHTAAHAFFMRQGNEVEALRHLKFATEISPMNAERHVALGELLSKVGDEHGAKVAFQEAIKNDPTKSSEIAEVLLASGKAEEAEVYFRWSLDNGSNTVHTYNRLGIALRRQGKWEDATREYKMAIALDPNDEVIYFNMAKAYLEGKRKREASQCFEMALKLNPTFKEAREELDAMHAGPNK